MTQKLALLTGTFTGAGQQSAALWMKGVFNVSIGSCSGTFLLERSFDDGSSYETAETFTLAATNLATVAFEAEDGVLYRLNCSALSSGTPAYRMAQ